MKGPRRFPCLSTHGAAGYAPGSYRLPDGTVVCGICGEHTPFYEHSGKWLAPVPETPDTSESPGAPTL